MTFTSTSYPPPIVTSVAAGNITQTTATLNGTVNANGQSTNVTFDYGPTTAYGQTINAAQSPVTGNTSTNVSANISGLAAGTLYHFRVNGGTVNGNDLTFTTQIAPNIDVTPTNFSFQANGTSTSGNQITLSSNVSWTAQVSQAWCHLSSLSGNSGNNQNLTITCDPNAGTAALSATITFKGTGATDKIVNVTIAGSAAYISVTSPASASNWMMTTTQSIQWSDNISDAVKVELYKGTTLITALSNSEAGSSYSWNIPMTLTPGADYKIRVTSTTTTTLYGESTAFTIAMFQGTVSDIDGNTYNTIQIGQQIWFKENLKVIHYRNSDVIQHVTSNSTWIALTAGAYSDYNNTSGNSSTYGRLYNWFTVNDSRKICPVGWHIPSDVEWTNLTNFVSSDGHSGTEGTALKSTSGWNSANGTNNYGFTGLPGGYRSSFDGSFNNLGSGGYLWSSTAYDASNAWTRELSLATVPRPNDNKIAGFSIRCIKD